MLFKKSLNLQPKKIQILHKKEVAAVGTHQHSSTGVDIYIYIYIYIERERERERERENLELEILLVGCMAFK